MTRDDILERVARHYSMSDQPLLLADLGKLLRDAHLWPMEGEERSLGEVVSATATEIKLIRDPASRAYVVVVPEGSEAIAENAIRTRHDVRLIKKLSRAVLLAFCVEVPQGELVFLRRSAPFKYVHGKEPPPSEGEFLLVEQEFRMPGLYVDANVEFDQATAHDLSNRIRAWSTKHNVDIEAFYKTERRSSPSDSADRLERKSNALERLYAAQRDGLGERLVVPMDIALLLSRTP